MSRRALLDAPSHISQDTKHLLCARRRCKYSTGIEIFQRTDFTQPKRTATAASRRPRRDDRWLGKAIAFY